MPKRTDISKILILGSGPIIIGQSAEFDYSGTQACKALKSEGYEVVLANSNPATIMTDPESADRTYIEPLTLEYLEEIIRIEREMAPGAGFAVLPTVGGQTALNLAIELSDGGVLEKYNATLIGASVAAIKKAEDRLFFKDAMQRIGLDVPKSALVNNTKDGIEFAGKIGFPVIIRPSFTLGGSGGGIAYNREEMLEVLSRGLDFSPVHEALIEESVLGWKEFELEVMRDTKDNVIIICSIENFDPMGSKFSIEQMIMTLSFVSRITSSSNSFQPSTDSSISASCTGEKSRPRLSTSSISSRLYAMPPPEPPSVNEGRIITGNPILPANSMPSFVLFTSADLGTSSPMRCMASLKKSRSSAFLMAATLAPIRVALYFSSTPPSESSIAKFSAVCPPTVGSTAKPAPGAISRSMRIISSRYSSVSGSI